MTPRICVCCGEPIALLGNRLSRNPNICASCSSLTDGMDEEPLPQVSSARVDRTPAQPEPQPAPGSNKVLAEHR